MRRWSVVMLGLAGVLVGVEAGAVEAGGEASAWHFESLSADGKRALLRRLDPEMRSAFDVRVVDVASGVVTEETRLAEMARVPASTIGGKAAELKELEFMLASPAFGRDLVQSARIASAFPFGACGRLAAGPAAIAFDAGDWLYVADAEGRVRRRVVEEAAYDPRLSADGKWLFFRRATGRLDGALARYELFVAPADLSAPPKVLPNTAGVRAARFAAHPDGQTAVALTVRPESACFVSIGLKPPFPTKKTACLETDGRVVESVVSPKGKWAAVSTKKRGDAHWRVRVVSLATGKVMRDEADAAGHALRAISDAGLLVESGARDAIVVDVTTSKVRALPPALDLGHRGFFKNDTELVYATNGTVAVLDVTKD
ncbi:MAG: PD40 domain-containing protein [Labilithrix sp.]|nr:PD40 domain-containing protein [Labilithrix sp.]MCW5809885.1 PD40 domain-containing protein [Labilithrix sp.]